MGWKVQWLASTILLWLLKGNCVDGFIGIHWGRYSTQSLVPSMVVDLLLQNGISDLRITAPSPHVMEALRRTNIGVTVALQNDFIRRKKAGRILSINDWVGNLIAVPVDRGINITTLVILDEPWGDFGNASLPITNATDVFREATHSLQRHNLTHIRTATAHSTDVLKTVSKPSEADFRDDIKDQMLESLGLLDETKSFFMYHIYPILSVQAHNWPIEFAFMDNDGSNFTIVDGNYTYTNAFDFMFDALVVALEKAGYPNMEIVVGNVGWPTDGGKHANTKNAERFYNSFLKHMAQKKGTPRRPNKNIDVYLSSLTDENKQPLFLEPYYRHRGIYNYDGTPKFKIDFTGQGRDVLPSTAQGTVKMPSRWCIFNGDMSNKTKVEEQMQLACDAGDCSSLSPDSSCSNLNYASKVSYAFNMFFQTQVLPDGVSCDFSGLGVISPFDPSVDTCRFPVEILTAEKVDGGNQVVDYVEFLKSGGARCNGYYYTTQLLLPIGFSIFVTFFSLRTQFGLFC